MNTEIDTKYTKAQNMVLAANGFHFKNDRQGFLPEMMERMYAERKKFKKDMLKAKQKYENTNDPDQKNFLEKDTWVLLNT